MSFDTIPVGRFHTKETVHAVRTPEQRAAIEAIVRAPEFDFACINPFRATLNDGRKEPYVGPFVFVWYTKDGNLHLRRFDKRGRVMEVIDS